MSKQQRYTGLLVLFFLFIVGLIAFEPELIIIPALYTIVYSIILLVVKLVDWAEKGHP